jgi:hypothetical protein
MHCGQGEEEVREDDAQQLVSAFDWRLRSINAKKRRE